jgi:hypothetical protein
MNMERYRVDIVKPALAGEELNGRKLSRGFEHQRCKPY